jgi:hypothetical protein
LGWPLASIKARPFQSEEKKMSVASASDHVFGQGLIVISMVISVWGFYLLARIKVKQNSLWSGLALLFVFFALAFEIGAAVYLW